MARRGRTACGSLLAVILGGGCEGPATPDPRDYGPWWTGAPVVGDLDGDGIEDLIAEFSEGGLTALRGATYEKLWNRPDRRVPVHDARRLMVFAGGTVVLAQPRALEILDPATGSTRTTIPLTDEVSRLCADQARVAVRQRDQQHWVLDVSAGQRDDAATPPACDRDNKLPPLCTATRARCEGTPASADVRLTDPATGTSAGVEFKQPGTPEVTVVGHTAGQPSYRLAFDPSGDRILAVDLVGHTLYLKRRSDVTALDARTGATLWRSPCAGTSGSLVVTASRVHFECDGHRTAKALRIVDPATGAVILDIGKVHH